MNATADLKMVIDYTYVGFSHKSVFKPSAWKRAEAVMGTLQKLGLVEPFDYGRGKGKWRTTKKGETYSFEDLGKIAYNQGLRIKPVRKYKTKRA